MKVFDLLEEIEEIVDTASGFPLTGKIMVDSEELLEIVREIRAELPQEMKQAQWLEGEQSRIQGEAKEKYETIIADARAQADALVDNDEITRRERYKAEEILTTAEEKATALKLGTYEYMDSILFSFQEKMEQLNATYFGDMFNTIETTFAGISDTLQANREEIKSMAYEVHIESKDYIE